jgi:hypothetical protein
VNTLSEYDRSESSNDGFVIVVVERRLGCIL